ncbi:hypothetical protein Q669_30720 [Labrenzia sp. C1B10]|uniref:hypothetical protein n=1 Tax=unclassified Labrenzia TaxID=2648686 RepID=UPI0003B8CF6D|nr:MULTISPECIES: hypothetical protein [unclassified Labrenzia]ERP95429.1 hypothetical protein Q669_30720 [Labrenzia sp. C1B10]ERS02920.1 hypothetical protein Q675_31740 [Labrenzia sp. C1B70]
MDTFLETLFSPDVFKILIGASVPIVGIFISQALGIYRDHRSDKRKREREARFLGLKLIILLEDFCGDCYGAAMNNVPEFDASNPSRFQFQTKEPDLFLPEKAAWELFDPKLTEQILWLESNLRNIKEAHASLNAFPPDYDDLFEHRAEDYSMLGIKTLDLIAKICKRYQFKTPARPGYYDPREGFERQLKKISKFWQEKADSQRKLFEQIDETIAPQAGEFAEQKGSDRSPPAR